MIWASDRQVRRVCPEVCGSRIFEGLSEGHPGQPSAENVRLTRGTKAYATGGTGLRLWLGIMQKYMAFKCHLMSFYPLQVGDAALQISGFAFLFCAITLVAHLFVHYHNPLEILVFHRQAVIFLGQNSP